MAFRRSRHDAEAGRRWRKFVRRERDLVARLGLPESVVATEDRFADLLMHGYLDHHDDPGRFTTDSLDTEGYALLVELVDRYFAAGFSDPGIVVLKLEDRRRLAHRHPDRTPAWLREE